MKRIFFVIYPKKDMKVYIVWCVMSEKCLKLKVFAKIDSIAFLASLGVK